MYWSEMFAESFNQQSTSTDALTKKIKYSENVV